MPRYAAHTNPLPQAIRCPGESRQNSKDESSSKELIHLIDYTGVSATTLGAYRTGEEGTKQVCMRSHGEQVQVVAAAAGSSSKEEEEYE